MSHKQLLPLSWKRKQSLSKKRTCKYTLTISLEQRPKKLGCQVPKILRLAEWMGRAMVKQIYLFITNNNNNKKVGKSQQMEAIKGGETATYTQKYIYLVKSNMSKSRSLFTLILASPRAVAPFTNQKVIRGPGKL